MRARIVARWGWPRTNGGLIDDRSIGCLKGGRRQLEGREMGRRIVIAAVIEIEDSVVRRRGVRGYVLQVALMSRLTRGRWEAYGARGPRRGGYRGGVFGFERRRGMVFGLGFEVLGRNLWTWSWTRTVVKRGWSWWRFRSRSVCVSEPLLLIEGGCDVIDMC